MKVLVTGATSGLGRNAVEVLLQAGHQVHATGRDALAGQQLQALGAHFTALDLVTATPQQYQQLVQDCDVVWHCAAKSSPWGSCKQFYQANVQVSDRLAAAAGQAAVPRFVHISTPSIYFDFRHHRDIDESYRASRFANHYASSKWLAEQAIAQRVREYPDTCFILLRPRGLFGPHDRVILPRLLAQIESDKGLLRLPRAGAAYLDLTFVLNVVQAMQLASEVKGLASGSVFNITNQQPQTLASMLDALLRQQLHIDYRLQALPYPLLYAAATLLEGIAALRQKEPLVTRYSAGAVNFDMTLSQQAAQQQLGYYPRYSLDEGITLTGSWWRQQGKANG